MKNWREVESKIKNSKHAVILSHRSPDGDSVGSSLALYHFLKNYISHVQVITPDPAPKFLSCLNGFDAIANYQENEMLFCHYLKLYLIPKNILTPWVGA